MKKLFMISAAAVVLLTGCISYEYQGKELDAPSQTVQICTDAKKIDMSKYSVLGTACASGDSVSVSQNDLYEKLSTKAKACGADIILVNSYQVVPAGNGRGRAVNASFDYGDSNSSWQQISRDVDGNYGNVRGISGEASTNGSYVRIIKAQYLKLNAPKAAAQTKK